MILGQLWYGWAPRGIEGVNQEQLVAASGKLGSRANSITQKVLPWCYALKSESRGWIEQNGVGVAFRRSPTGTDAHGREGAFFVHALIWESGAMPAELLAGLWDAAVWVDSPPDEPPDRLELIRSPEALGLGAAHTVAPEAMATTLAGLLGNVARQRKSRIELPPADAYSVASRLVTMLPMRFGLLSFSTHEERDRATAYDVVAGPATGPQHLPVGPDQDPAVDWMGAAQLLLAASDGDEDAASLVDLVGAEAATLPDFLERIRRWAQLEKGSLEPGREFDPQAVALLAKSPALVGRLLQGERASGIARMFIAGGQIDGLLDAMRRADQAPPFIAALRRELLTEPPPGIVQSLLRLERWFPSEARALAVALADSWPDGSLRQLSPDQAAALAGLLVTAESASQVGLARIVDELTSIPEFAGSLVAAIGVPAEWRASAAASHPEQVSARGLAAAVAQDRLFAHAFVTRVGQSGIRSLAVAIERVDVPLALACAERAGACLASGDDHLKLVWPVIMKTSSREQLGLLDRYSRLRIDFSENWMNAAIAALVEEVLRVREGYEAIPGIGRAAFGVRLSSSTTRIDTWRRLSQNMRSSGVPRIGQAMRDVSTLVDPRDADAALEIVVDAVCERFDRRGEEWLAAVTIVASGAHEANEEFARRLARAAVRQGRGDRASVARWTVKWVADGMDEKTIPRDVIRDPIVIDLANHLRHGDIEVVRRYAAERHRRSSSRKWLKDVERRARKNFPGRRRFARFA